MKRFTGIKGTLILVILVAAIVGYYGYLSNKTSKQAEADLTLSKVQTVLLKNLDMNYPPTPKEVIKYYGEITLCLYDGECQDNDVEKLAAKLVQLYDEELVDNNPWAEYLISLKNDVGSFRTRGIKLTGFSPAGSTSVDMFSQDGFEWARILCTFYVKDDKGSNAVNQIYLLRKDDGGRWKIYGWDLAENVKIGDE